MAMINNGLSKLAKGEGKPRLMTDFLYIFGTVIFTVYGQLVVKWQVSKVGGLPSRFPDKLFFLGTLLLNPWIISGIFGSFLAMLCWLSAMTKFELSFAYPLMSLAFVMVLVLSVILFHETASIPKVLGVLLIISGIVVASRG